MQRSSDLTWRFNRRLGGNAQHKRATGRFGLLSATFFGVHRKRATATFFGVHGYVYRGSWLHLSRYTATFIGVHQSAIGYIFRGLTAPLPCSACVLTPPLIAVPKVRFLRFLHDLPTGEDESQCYHVLDVRHGKRINIRELDDLLLRVATTTRKVVRFENQVIE
jgi:hypothetical protein